MTATTTETPTSVRRRFPEVGFRVLLDGQPPGAAHGGDVDQAGDGAVIHRRLYQLLRQPGPITERTFQITFGDGGVQADAVTFG